VAEVSKFILFSDKSDDHNVEELSATAKRVDWVKLTRATIDYLSKADFIVKIHFMKSTGLILPASASSVMKPGVTITTSSTARILAKKNWNPCQRCIRPRHSLYEESEKRIDPGQVIQISTDGIKEACNAKGEMFGTGRLKNILRDHAQKPAKEILAALVEAMEDFRYPRLNKWKTMLPW